MDQTQSAQGPTPAAAAYLPARRTFVRRSVLVNSPPGHPIIAANCHLQR